MFIFFIFLTIPKKYTTEMLCVNIETSHLYKKDMKNTLSRFLGQSSMLKTVL